MALPLAATIAAQPGPQTEFLRSPADICIYGGAAGGGKTVGLILEPLRYATRVANFTAVFFRRSTPQITNPGGLWDESQNFYPRLGGIPHVGMREWRWPRGGRIKFSHLQFDSTVYDWQGAQIALICFDELTHFTAHQFFYMVSRNRSTCGLRPIFAPPATPTPTAGSLTSWRGGSTRRAGWQSPSAPVCCVITSASRRRPSGLIGPKSWCNTSLDLVSMIQVIATSSDERGVTVAERDRWPW